jgi:hypothetical protein
MADILKSLRVKTPKRAHLKLVSSAAEIMQDRPQPGDKTFAPRLLGVIAESSPNPTLSGIEEG